MVTLSTEMEGLENLSSEDRGRKQEVKMCPSITSWSEVGRPLCLRFSSHIISCIFVCSSCVRSSNGLLESILERSIFGSDFNKQSHHRSSPFSRCTYNKKSMSSQIRQGRFKNTIIFSGHSPSYHL